VESKPIKTVSKNEQYKQKIEAVKSIVNKKPKLLNEVMKMIKV